MVIGCRGVTTARRLYDALPADYRESGPFMTDRWGRTWVPRAGADHCACRKGSGATNGVKRFFLKARQRCARPVRKTLPFSRKLSNHIGALWHFVRLYIRELLSRS